MTKTKMSFETTEQFNNWIAAGFPSARQAMETPAQKVKRLVRNLDNRKPGKSFNALQRQLGEVWSNGFMEAFGLEETPHPDVAAARDRWYVRLQAAARHHQTHQLEAAASDQVIDI